jgi:hypothetical protein
MCDVMNEVQEESTVHGKFRSGLMDFLKQQAYHAIFPLIGKIGCRNTVDSLDGVCVW